MAAPKLTGAEVTRLRELHAAGVGATALAERFGVSRGYVHRLVAGEARPIAAAESEASTNGPVLAAVTAFVAELEPSGAQVPLAEIAKALAAQLDAAGTRSTAASGMAAASVARQLQDVLAALTPGDDQGATEAALRRVLEPLKGMI